MADADQQDQTFLITYPELNKLFHYLKKRPWEEANSLVAILQNLPPGQAVPPPQEPKKPLKVAPKPPDPPKKEEPPPEAAKE